MQTLVGKCTHNSKFCTHSKMVSNLRLLTKMKTAHLGSLHFYFWYVSGFERPLRKHAGGMFLAVGDYCRI